jgi:hypothetical protein
VFSGLLSGNLGVVKSLLTEITDDTNRGAAFAYMSLAWAIGCVIAPLAGGLLCKPTEKYPTVFPDRHGQLFVEFPYLLPCLVCVTWSMFSAMFCMCFMKETRGTKKKPAQPSSPSQKGIEMAKLSSFGSSSTLSTRSGYSSLSPDADLEAGEDDQDSQHTVALHAGTRSPLSGGRNGGSPRSPGGDGDELHFTPASAGSKISTMQAQLQQALSVDNAYSSATANPLTEGRAAQLPALEAKKDSFVIDGGDSDEETGDVEDQHRRSPSSPGPGRKHGAQGYKKLAPAALAIEDREGQAGAEVTEEEDEPDEGEELCCTTCCGAPDSGPSMDSSSHNLKSAEEGNSSSTKSGDSGEAKKLSTAVVLRQRVVLLATGNYGMLCMASILIEETLPLFLKADINEGGFGFNSMHIGFLLSISGGVMLLFTSFILPVMSRRSKFWMFRVGTIGVIPVAASMPVIALLNRTVWSHYSPAVHGWLLWTILPTINVLKSVFTCFAFSAVMIQVNHSVHDEYLGAVNGLGQSLAALARAIGPALGGAMWSISTKHHFVWLNFIVICCSFLVCLYLNQLLPASLDFKKKVRNGKQTGDADGTSGEGGAPMMH